MVRRATVRYAMLAARVSRPELELVKSAAHVAEETVSSFVRAIVLTAARERVSHLNRAPQRKAAVSA